MCTYSLSLAADDSVMVTLSDLRALEARIAALEAQSKPQFSIHTINNNNDDNQEDQKKTVVIAQREYDDYIHDLRDSFNGLDLEYAVTAHLKKWKYKLEKSILF